MNPLCWLTVTFIFFFNNTHLKIEHKLNFGEGKRKTTQQLQLSCQSAAAALSVRRRGWWEVWGPVRKHAALVWSHSSSLFGLSCIRAPLLPRFTRGNSTAQNAFPPSCCSVLSVFRWVFPANQEPANSTCNRSHWPSSVCLFLYSAGCHGSRADSGGFNIDQESWWKSLLQLWTHWPV